MKFPRTAGGARNDKGRRDCHARQRRARNDNRDCFGGFAPRNERNKE